MTLLTKRMVAKPWGKDTLPAPFVAPEGKRIGEVWFEPPPEMPDILIKYIFTNEKLSVQVHPTDSQAREMGETDRGKEECWLVIDAEPGATLGIGFKQAIDAETMRAAALDGSIEQLMEWHPVKPGDFFYIPAGTVHAIGAGVSLIEIQQNSDITYRLYDYGRPRELHLDKGIAVARGEPHDPALRMNVSASGTQKLVNSRYFTAYLLEGEPPTEFSRLFNKSCLVLPQSTPMSISGEPLTNGACGFARKIADVDFSANGFCLLVSPA